MIGGRRTAGGGRLAYNLDGWGLTRSSFLPAAGLAQGQRRVVEGAGIGLWSGEFGTVLGLLLLRILDELGGRSLAIVADRYRENNLRQAEDVRWTRARQAAICVTLIRAKVVRIPERILPDHHD